MSRDRAFAEQTSKVMLKEYEDDEESEGDPFEDASDDEAPQLITSRADFNSMMDEFLNDYEILGRKMKPKLSGETGMEKLDTLRRALGQDERVRDIYGDDSDNDEQYDDLKEMEEPQKDRWDCETVLSQYPVLDESLVINQIASQPHTQIWKIIPVFFVQGMLNQYQRSFLIPKPVCLL